MNCRWSVFGGAGGSRTLVQTRNE